MGRAFAVGILLLLLGTVYPARAVTLSLLAEEGNPPANYSDPHSGHVVGIATEIVEAMMAAAGVEYVFTVLPWGRAYQTTLREANTCLFSTNRTPEREPLFKWVGPMTAGGWVLFARADATFAPLRSIEEARPYSIGTRVNDAVETYLLSVGGLHIESVSNATLNLKKLESRRIDLWAAGEQMGPHLARREGIEIKPVLTLRRSELWLACHPSVSDDTIADLDAALDKLRAAGALQAIVDRYF